jgi:hypothetical protein
VAKFLFDASGYLICWMTAAIEMNSIGHFMDDDDGGGDSGSDGDKYNSPLHMIIFPYLS